jgi:mRNA-degrading endonuclease YafQ of YafQ-DinJ toxin-antitoxin module
MNFETSEEFEKDLKASQKKWRSLPNDIELVKQVIEPLYTDRKDVNRAELRKAFFNNKRATILLQTDEQEVVKMRLDCVSLGTKNILRLVYIRTGETVTFVELYSKSDKSREDDSRYNLYLI